MEVSRLRRKKIYDDSRHNPNASLRTRDHLLSITIELIRFYRLSKEFTEIRTIVREIESIQQRRSEMFYELLQSAQWHLSICRDFPQEASQLWQKYTNLLHRILHGVSRNTKQQPPVHLLNEIHKNSDAKKRVELLKDEADKTKPKLFLKKRTRPYPLSCDGIKKEVALLHRIRLTGDYGWAQIDSAIGPMYTPKDGFQSFIEGYKDRYIVQRSNFLLFSVHTNRKSYPHPNRLPESTIDIYNPTKDALLEFDEKLPGLKFSEMELSVDIYCTNPQEVRKWRKIIDKHLYIPLYTKKTIAYNSHEPSVLNRDPFTERTSVLPSNFTRIFLCKRGIVARLYERGPDDKKIPYGSEGKKGWPLPDVNRVRIEFVLFSDSSRVKRWLLGINTLNDFINHFSMERSLKGAFSFKTFKPRVLKDWSSFMEKFLEIREQGRDVSKYANEERKLDDLKELMIKAIRKFDENWNG